MDIIFLVGGIVIGWLACYIWFRKMIKEAEAMRREGEKNMAHARQIIKNIKLRKGRRGR